MSLITCKKFSRGGGNSLKFKVKSEEFKVKGCSDFTTLSIPHDQFTAHNAACATSLVAAPFAFYGFPATIHYSILP